MNILQVNKYFYVRDGISRYFFELSELLKRKSHKVSYFSMSDKKNVYSSYEKYFISNFNFSEIKYTNAFRNLARMIYSIEAKNKLKKLLDSEKIDIVHIHSLFHYISPSILAEIKCRKIPIVVTVHDYHYISPNYLLFHNGKICEVTKPDKLYKAILHKCCNESYFYSLAELFEKYIHKIFIKEQDQVDIFICPSKFVMNKYIEYGFPRNKLKVIPHFVNCDDYTPKFNGSRYILYFGRLSEEKGLRFLLKVMKELPKIKLKIAGEGLERKFIINYILTNNLNNIEILPYQSQADLTNLILNSKFTILPSIWYEGFGLVILEANACGKPVIASKIGGIPEVIKNGVNGYLFNSENIIDCKDKITKLWEDSRLAESMGKKARKIADEKFDSENHYQQIINTYESLI